MAMELEAKGDKRRAYDYFVQSVSITPQMAAEVIKVLI